MFQMCERQACCAVPAVAVWHWVQACSTLNLSQLLMPLHVALTKHINWPGRCMLIARRHQSHASGAGGREDNTLTVTLAPSHASPQAAVPRIQAGSLPSLAQVVHMISFLFSRALAQAQDVAGLG